MKGMNAKTGRAVLDLDHLRQSIADILSTPIGSRLMRRDYGSLLFRLLDQPANPSLHLRLYAAIVSALLRWEPRLQLTRVKISSQADGQTVIDLDGYYVNNNRRRPLSLSVPVAVTLP